MTILDFNTAKRQDELTDNIDLRSIRERLHANPKAFVQWLYSGRAYTSKGEARIGNVTGEQGSSLGINLATGLWKDHATDESGDLITLYRAWAGHRGEQDFVQSLKEIARDYLGDPVEVIRPPWKPTPLDRIAEQKAKLGSAPRPENLELGAPVATYTYYDLHGKVIATVRRYEPLGTRDSKTFRPWCWRNGQWVPGAPDMRPLYHLPQVAVASRVVLAEGEGCAEALNALGIVATTAMQGARAPLDKTDWTPLAGKTVVIWPDKDEPGFQYARDVAARLTALGCTVLGVTPPDDRPSAWDAADCVAEGGDVHGLINKAAPLNEPKAASRIRILDIDDLEDITPPPWLIVDVITAGGLSILWGRSNTLKSFVALDIAMSIATGLEWHGVAVMQGPVVYVAAEGQYGFGKRVVGWRKIRGKDAAKPAFWLVPQVITLNSDLDDMVVAILALGVRPKLIVIDTLARTFGVADENKTADMNAYVTAADRLRDLTGAHVMIIHHSGVHEEKRERGSGVLRGAADTVIKIARSGDKIDLINRAPEGKQKDAEEFKTIKLEARKVYFEVAGEERNTLILNTRDPNDPLGGGDEEGGSDAGSGGSGGGGRLGKNQTAVVAALREAGMPLGFSRILSLTGIDNGSLGKCLSTLVEKNILFVDYDPTGNTKVWGLV